MLLMASARSRITVNSMYAKISAISYDWLKNDMVVVKELFIVSLTTWSRALEQWEDASLHNLLSLRPCRLLLALAFADPHLHAVGSLRCYMPVGSSKRKILSAQDKEYR